jgi:hypothetical protein
MRHIEAYFEEVCGKAGSDGLSDKLRELLSGSLFYYCAGVDPTPVNALSDEYPLFIYSDNLKYKDAALSEVFKKLTGRLLSLGFTLLDSRDIDILDGGILARLTRDGADFLVLYIKGDSWDAYRKIYMRGDRLMPRCIANIRYEMNTRNFLPIERKVEFILGYSYSGIHTPTRKFKYLGDYSEKEVRLFAR